MESAGNRLKKLRLEKGINLEEVQKKTRIKLNILRAIEGDGLTDLSPVYLKGFIKIYCKFLGADPKDYILGYREAKERVPIQEKQAKGTSMLKTASVKLVTIRPNKRVKKAILIISAGVLVFFFLFQLGRFVSSRRNPEDSKRMRLSRMQPPAKVAVIKTKTVQTTAAKAAISTSTVLPQDTVGIEKKETSTGIKLIIRAKENCWVSLKADGKLVFQRVLEKGRFESWKAKDKFSLSVANAGGVELEINNRPFLNLGRRGQSLKNIVITKEGLTIR
ncbi:MAG TPA: RodZ domain-containing protein [Candidatus Margulisiibacteriota bacterium]|nr:RodZ domain-containing protein [Candidatus Margulisiibacteriota bacterium]